MKKKLIALAVAGAMTAPMAAMAEAKISGVLQAEVVSVSSDAGGRDDGLYMQDASTVGTENGHNPSGLFFSASHDLGNGMKGLVKYGMALTNDGYSGERDAYVGLTGGFGTVLAGRMGTPYKSMYDPFIGTFMQARGNNGASGGVWGHGSYVNNALAYANKFGPATVVAALVIDEANDATDVSASGSTAGNHALSFSVKMPVGPVELAFAHTAGTDYNNSNTTAAEQTRSFTKLAVKYAAGDMVIAGQFEARDDSNTPAGGASDGSEDTYMLVMGSYKMGANTISASYGMHTDSGAGRADLDNSYMAVGVTHAMSKQVRVHAGYRVSTFDNGAAADTDEAVLGAGLRVSF